MARYHQKPPKLQKIARERIATLFEQAKLKSKTSPPLAMRYVILARKIGMKYKVRFPSLLRRQFCRHCNSFLVPGRNCRVRLNKGMVISYCEHCKHFSRFRYKH